MSDEVKLHEALRDQGMLRPEYDVHYNATSSLYIEKLLIVAEAADDSELAAENDSLETENDGLRDEINGLIAENDDLERKIQELEKVAK